MAKPLYIKNFIPNSICSFEYFNKLLKNHPKKNIHIIDNKRKKYDFSGETKNNQTYIIEDTVESKMLKPIFFNIRDTLINKFSELKNCIRWDAHFMADFLVKVLRLICMKIVLIHLFYNVRVFVNGFYLRMKKKF